MTTSKHNLIRLISTKPTVTKALNGLFVLVLSVIPINNAKAENEDITAAGDYLQYILPATAGLSTFVVGNPEGGLWDKEGTIQWTKSFTGMMGTVQIWKQVEMKNRPLSSNTASFPSGHTAAAFQGAGFISQRYGIEWGIPAYALALFTGYSRIQADAHFANDVAAGMSIGLMYNWLFVTPKGQSSEPVSIMPMLQEDGFGFNLIVSEPHLAHEKSSKKQDPKFRFNFSFGPAYVIENEVTSPSASGTTINLADFSKEGDPTATATIDFTYTMDKRNEFSFYVNPFEAQDSGIFNSPVNFAGEQFSADVPTAYRWRYYEGRISWIHNLTPRSPWIVKLGLGVSFGQMKTQILTETQSADQDEWFALPLLNTTVGYEFTEQLSARMTVEGGWADGNWLADPYAYLNYRFSDHWDVSAGYSYFAFHVDGDDIKNTVQYNMPYLAVAHSW